LNCSKKRQRARDVKTEGSSERSYWDLFGGKLYLALRNEKTFAGGENNTGLRRIEKGDSKRKKTVTPTLKNKETGMNKSQPHKGGEYMQKRGAS